jgi:outer membrane protein TolC
MILLRGAMRSVAMLLLAAVACAAAAQGNKPLTLEEALTAADQPHPDLLAVEADRSLALADQELAGARSDFSVVAMGALQRVKPTLQVPGYDDYMSDNYLRILGRVPLLDFGRTSNAMSAAQAVVDARDLTVLEARDRRRLEIMARFFDVLLADLRYAADNEHLAVAYVAFDIARDRHDQKQISQVDLLELEARSQERLVARNEGEKRQRLARALLADAMNQPGKLASELADPPLPENERPLPDYEVLHAAMLESNPRLKAQQQLLLASRLRLESIRAETGPRIDAELEAAEYGQRRLSGRDDLRAGLVLTWPLYQGRRVSGDMAREQAQFQKLQAETEKLKRDLSQALLAAWMEADQLRRTARRAAKIEADYRDLALERARGQYEMEYRTNLGDSMARTMEAKLNQRNVEYRLALALARLEALLGKSLPAAANGNAASAK